ncbi:MAG: Imm53 family immunity protein [Simkaniaceae bacterium]
MIQNDFLWFQYWCKIFNSMALKSKVKVQIATLDNPGWLFKVNLEKTMLKNQVFQKVEIDRFDNDWIFCFVRDNQFEVACGPANLLEALQVFRKWVESFLSLEEKQFLENFECMNHMPSEGDELLWLQYWFYIHCNGDWEHGSGIKIEMSDVSGWVFEVNLEETELENKIFQMVNNPRNEIDWLNCKINNHLFKAACGLTNLIEVIKIFRNWAMQFLTGPDQKNLALLLRKGLHFMEKDDFSWLQKWYYLQCNGKWEQIQRIRIEALETPGWLLIIDLRDTALENEAFRMIHIEKSDNEWIHCDVKKNIFEGRCGPTNLSDLLEIFHNWSRPVQ